MVLPMLSNAPAIEVKDLTKRYQIYAKPADRLKQMVMPKLAGLASRAPKNYYEEINALENVSYTFAKGRTIGVVGSNGSGKSTLLQLLSGIIQPTAGTVEVSGRLAPILELGAGFNQEFTGRQNIYIGASVFGVDDSEISLRLEEIIEFSGIGEFIDRPLKTYSSGMYLRLAFSIVAHIDADILLIDEVLAVGDYVFAQKCMRFLRRFTEHGTLIIVSHDNATITSLCDEAIWLNGGRLVESGPPEKVIQSYLKAGLQDIYGQSVNLESTGIRSRDANTQSSKTQVDRHEADDVFISIFKNIEKSDGWQTGKAELIQVDFVDKSGVALAEIKGGEAVRLLIKAKANQSIYSPILGFYVKDKLGQSLFGEHTFTYIDPPLAMVPGDNCEACFEFRLPFMPNGDYSITASIAEGTPYDHVQHHWIHDAIVFKVNSKKMRYGLVGIEFDGVSMKKIEP
jgi:lipopolysaccharide transport system ATP-binding protein